MNIKTFLVGAASGALVFATASWILGINFERGLTEGTDTRAEPSEAPIVGVSDSIADRPSEILTSSDLDTVETGRTVTPTPNVPDVKVTEEPTADSRSDPGTFPIGETKNQPTEEGDVPNNEFDWMTDRRAELEAEPKDDSWAYYMEEAILQFLTSHPAIADFDISYIQCRTTMCQIEVIGYDESTGPTWQRVMFELRQQPWSEFSQTGSSSANVNDRFIIIATMRR